MEILIMIMVFLIGLCVGSFLNVVVDRIPQKKSIVVGRSQCDFCGHMLSWYDLIPVVSFTLLKGKCRYCKKKLSLQYPLVEIATGVLFVTSFILLGIPQSSIALLREALLLLLFALFFALSLMDIKYGILADSIVISSAIIIFAFLALSPHLFLAHFFIGCVACMVLLLLFIITQGRGMGLGDVKLAFVMGLLLGFPSILVAFYVAFLTGAIVAIILVVAKRKKLVGGTIAFGPFLLLGTYSSWFFGNILWTYILHLLGV